MELDATEIVPAEHSGGATTSHTISVHDLVTLLQSCGLRSSFDEYERAVLDDNVLAKKSSGARKRTFRYLRELYLLRDDAILFRALRDLWPTDQRAQPLLAGLCALARDPVFRSTASAIHDATPGEIVESEDLEAAVEAQYPGNYNDDTRAKIGRNTSSSWEQTGHLTIESRFVKRRTRATCLPPNVAYALLLGHLQGVRGELLFDTPWAKILDVPRSHLFTMASLASQQGLIEFRHSGGITEVGFRELLRPMEGRLL